jgi:hypothetical protein
MLLVSQVDESHIDVEQWRFCRIAVSQEVTLLQPALSRCAVCVPKGDAVPSWLTGGINWEPSSGLVTVKALLDSVDCFDEASPPLLSNVRLFLRCNLYFLCCLLICVLFQAEEMVCFCSVFGTEEVSVDSLCYIQIMGINGPYDYHVDEYNASIRILQAQYHNDAALMQSLFSTDRSAEPLS